MRIAFILISLVIVYILSPSYIHKGREVQRALPQIQAEVARDYTKLLDVSEQFVQVTQQTEKVEQWLPVYESLRDAFKQVEFAIEYADREDYNNSFNGAPLPKIEPKQANVHVLQPQGLQVIDELLYEDEVDKEVVRENAQKLYKAIKKRENLFKQLPLSERQYFEALRYNVIRVASLSITGFDTPGSVRGLKDAEIELASIQKYITFFSDELNSVEKPELLKEALQITQEAQIYIKNKDFDTFDRLVFIKDYLQPLYTVIWDIHYVLEYETWLETDPITQPLTYDATGFFEPNFLNPFAYVSFNNDSLYPKRKALGRLLFYDPLLSKTQQQACVNCHHPDKAFTDALPKSESLNGEGVLQRNAMTLPYSVYAMNFFYDLRAPGLENQFEHVIVSEDEFHTSFKDIIKKLNQSPTYKNLFKEAFPDQKGNEISPNSLNYAFAAYVMSLGEFDSKFDQFMQGKSPHLSPQEKEGFNLFAGKAACATCHFIPTFSGLVPPFYQDTESEILGVPKHKDHPWTLDEDKGRMLGTFMSFSEIYEHSFKTVTVRNAEKTAPYMHNGVFDTLEEVMDFYNEGGGAGRGLDVPFQTLDPNALELTPEEVQAIIAFMRALNDSKVPPAVKENELPRDFPHSTWNKRKVPYGG